MTEICANKKTNEKKMDRKCNNGCRKNIEMKIEIIAIEEENCRWRKLS